MSPEDPDRPVKKPVHGHTGPTTSAEDSAREAPGVSPEDAARIAEEASREEDA
ncbi:MAG: hypothetical protein Q8Q88_20210 [Phenylobacterium sp.]|uniref:hypothetical protein n=1 Tax=Phenylobacterium sp. TaxID=1871053 RepID=UPI0027337133|nr:hypothetical protein [Phenylobacterium sp.]MDP3749368.1 hypothetical protein [Phenylobacterium sp.]